MCDVTRPRLHEYYIGLLGERGKPPSFFKADIDVCTLTEALSYLKLWMLNLAEF